MVADIRLHPRGPVHLLRDRGGGHAGKWARRHPCLSCETLRRCTNLPLGHILRQTMAQAHV
eukprot:7951980-Heterocapsa_arctica.AAC.1